MSANTEMLVLKGATTGGVGTAGNDVISAHDALGPVTIDGGAGDDILIGGAGDVTLTGGSGNDVYHLDGGHDTIVEAANGGFDTEIVSVAGTVTMAANVEQLDLTGAATGAVGTSGNDVMLALEAKGGVTLDGGAGDDTLFGGTFDDTLMGGDGNDVLAGGGGTNTLIGGAGNDVYILTTGIDTIVEDVNGGFDTMISSAPGTTQMAANVEQLILTGASTGGVGTSGNDIITARDTNVALTIDGGAGNDVLTGSAGDDRLIGGTGNDVLFGGGGNNVFDFTQAGSGHDTIVDFHAIATSGHDMIDLTGRGFSAAALGTAILITADVDGFAQIAIGADTIKLIDVHVVDITAGDFSF